MDKSSASSQSQRSSAGRRERVTPPTSYPEIMTPPSTQSMVAPNSSASQPPKTSDGRMYLRILRDVAERIKPTGRLSEVFSQLAAQLRVEEAPPSSLPLDVPTESVKPVDAPAMPLLRQFTPGPTVPFGRSNPAEHDKIQNKETKFKEAVESGEAEGSRKEEEIEGEVQGLVEKVSEERTLEVVDLDEGRSSDDRETLDERAKRRNLRTAMKEKNVEVDGELVESAARAVADFKLAERERKGKRMASPNKKRKPRSASPRVMIRETATNPIQTILNQEVEQHLGVFERMKVDLDQKLLEAMIHFKDPKLRRNCAGRVSDSRPAQSGRKIHHPLMRMIDIKEHFFGYIKGIGFYWLLEHAPCVVPINLAKEFFTSFHFKYTTDLEDESIEF